MFVRYRVVVDIELSVGTAFGQQFRQEWFVNVVVQIGDGDFYCRRFTDVVLVDFKSRYYHDERLNARSYSGQRIPRISRNNRCVGWIPRNDTIVTVYLRYALVNEWIRNQLIVSGGFVLFTVGAGCPTTTASPSAGRRRRRRTRRLSIIGPVHSSKRSTPSALVLAVEKSAKHSPDLPRNCDFPFDSEDGKHRQSRFRELDFFARISPEGAVLHW